MAIRISETPSSGSGGTGDVVGPSSSTDNAVARFDGTTGKLLQNSTVTLGDTGAINNTLGADVVGLLIKQFTGATSNLIEWRNSANSLRAYVKPNGSIQGAEFKIADDLSGFDNDHFVTSQGSRINWSNTTDPAWDLIGVDASTDFLSMLRIVTNKAATIAAIIKGATSQTANLFESRNSSDAVLNYVAANGRIQADSGFGAKRTTTAISYTALVTDYFVGVTSNAAARTVTLPAASACKNGQVFVIKDEAGTANSANNITIARAGADTIDGATSIVISADYGVCRLYSNGSDGFFTF